MQETKTKKYIKCTVFSRYYEHWPLSEPLLLHPRQIVLDSPPLALCSSPLLFHCLLHSLLNNISSSHLFLHWKTPGMLPMLRIRIRDPVLFGSLDPKPAWKKIGVRDSGSYIWELSNFFGVKNTSILCQFSVADLDPGGKNPDPGSGMKKNPDPGSTSRIRNTECYTYPTECGWKQTNKKCHKQIGSLQPITQYHGTDTGPSTMTYRWVPVDGLCLTMLLKTHWIRETDLLVNPGPYSGFWETQTEKLTKIRTDLSYYKILLNIFFLGLYQGLPITRKRI